MLIVDFLHILSVATFCEISSNIMKLQTIKRKSGHTTVTNDLNPKKSRLSDNNPTELMVRLEEFNDVWNNCPNIKSTDFIPCESLEEYNGGKDGSNFYEKSCNKIINKNNHNDNNNIYCNSKDGRTSLIVESNNFGRGNNSWRNPIIELSDLKRKKAVDEQRHVQEHQKKIIKKALSVLEGERTNNNIVFSDDDHDNNKQNNASGKHLWLFDSDDDETLTDLKLNKQFGGKKGQKLLELQSKYAYDSRFVLDDRFEESDSETDNNEVNVFGNSEKEKQLAILTSIVNREIKPLSLVKQSTKQSQHKWMVRFDPTREDHSKYLLEPNQNNVECNNVENRRDKKAKGKGKKNKKDESNIKEEVKPKVSGERFYTVKENLKEVLSKEENTVFSLLKLFGPKETTPVNIETKETQTIKKSKYNASKNPFKYDSSDSELEEEKPETTTKEDVTSSKSAANSWRTTFFFTDNDSRFKEALEFLKDPGEQGDAKEFAEKRKMLKVFIKKRFKKNNRKHSLFKKKLGGLKKKIISKEKKSVK